MRSHGLLATDFEISDFGLTENTAGLPQKVFRLFVWSEKPDD